MYGRLVETRLIISKLRLSGMASRSNTPSRIDGKSGSRHKRPRTSPPRRKIDMRHRQGAPGHAISARLVDKYEVKLRVNIIVMI